MRHLFITLTLLVISVAAQATPVGPMNYQGRLLDNNGIPITGSYSFIARIYDDPTNGTLQYQETHSNVTVNDGVYSFKIGNGPRTAGSANWDTDLWAGNLNNLYLEIAVEGETLSPRHELTSAPHAFTSTLALALGNKTAEEFDNILEGVCVASKGKWLELANSGKGACLGVGASFPGPTTSVWYNFTANNDFSNLDLTRADISGIEFGGANLSGTTFKETTYSVAGMSSANLANTQWDGAMAADVSPANLDTSTNLSGASFKNMAMDKWGLGWLGPYPNQYTGMSAAYLSSCPASQLSQWECRLMRASGSSYFLAGPYANLSVRSAAAAEKVDATYLDIDNDKLDDLQLNYAVFVGIRLTNNFVNSSLYFADLSQTTLINAKPKNTSFAGTKFVGARIENVIFSSDVFMPTLDFSKAHLNRVSFENAVTGANFTGATLEQVDFSVLGSSKFIGSRLEDVRINDNMQGNAAPYQMTFDGVQFYGEFYLADIYLVDPTEFVFKDLSFMGGELSGDFSGVVFTGTVKFSRMIFENIDLCAASIPVTMEAPHPELATVIWRNGIECPDGTDYGLGSALMGACNSFTRMVPTSLANCTAGIPSPF